MQNDEIKKNSHKKSREKKSSQLGLTRLIN
jgi:hypothetical protein